MKFSNRLRAVMGATLASVAVMTPIGPLLEQRMLTQMLLQMPALFVGGALMMSSAPNALPVRRWNLAGITGLLASSLALAFWMIPVTIDRAVASAAWDAARAGSVAGAGALTILSWRSAPPVVQAFFVGNLVWMGVAVGQIYQDDGPRLCNAYLLDDQATTGVAMTLLALAIGGLWGCRAIKDLSAAAAMPASVQSNSSFGSSHRVDFGEFQPRPQTRKIEQSDGASNDSNG